MILGNDDSARPSRCTLVASPDAILEGRNAATAEVVNAVQAGDDEFVEVQDNA